MDSLFVRSIRLDCSVVAVELSQTDIAVDAVLPFLFGIRHCSRSSTPIAPITNPKWSAACEIGRQFVDAFRPISLEEVFCCDESNSSIMCAMIQTPSSGRDRYARPDRFVSIELIFRSIPHRRETLVGMFLLLFPSFFLHTVNFVPTLNACADSLLFQFQLKLMVISERYHLERVIREYMQI
ncbi:hypothetical protein CEXT_789541 [Caerostris extrusa]|uniref:Uncharacterized protein n=1 Tax=Caerostris extrusa TaxID=172846 RepID=A0AAV4M6B6_CAEEX|nr:hypothetical protein CEXT_789541 [Caerostris extrusa]